MNTARNDSKSSNKRVLCQTAVDALLFFIRRQSISGCQQIDAATLSAWGLSTEEFPQNSQVVMFNGESLSQVPYELRERFWGLLWGLKESGVSLVFEPTHIQSSWLNDDDAKFQFDLGFQIADFVLLDLHNLGNLYRFSDLNGLLKLFEVYTSTQLFISKADKSSVLPKLPAHTKAFENNLNFCGVAAH